MTELALIPRTQALEQLSGEVIRQHGLVVQAGMDLVEHAILAGEALLQAKTQVPRGQWERWLEHSFDGVGVSPQALRSYMRLARHKEILRRENPTTLKAASRLLRRESAGDSRVDPTVVAEARRLREAGMTYAAIGTELDISLETARRYANPDRWAYAARYHKQRTHAARRALRRAERDAAAKNLGGDLSHAYSFLRRALEALDAASRSEQDREAKATIHTAMNSMYNAEDSLNKAIRISRGKAA